MTTIKELLNGQYVEQPSMRATPDWSDSECFELKAISRDATGCKEEDATSTELIEVTTDPYGVDFHVSEDAYCVFCKDTAQMWFAPNKRCLNKNFIYRDDLVIQWVTSNTEVIEFWKKHMAGVCVSVSLRKTCYILDIPMNETYEVYYQSDYPTVRYGSATPKGTAIIKCKDRFHRDAIILQLENKYANSSMKSAGEYTGRKFEKDEAIIVSDGAWWKEKIASSVFYLDSDSVIHFTEGGLPSDAKQGIIIAEIKAATNALSLCYQHRKKRITYYYDNTNILNVFKNTRTEYIPEIKEYKRLCEKMHRYGYEINFVELHPKTGENRDVENKALMYFHNQCDAACSSMCDLVKKEYKMFAANGNVKGKYYKEVRQVKTQAKPAKSQ